MVILEILNDVAPFDGHRVRDPIYLEGVPA